MEYLSTYAWSIVVIVVVGILLWAIFSPGYVYPTRSTVAYTSTEKVGVLDYALREDGTLDLVLVNRLDFDVFVKKIIIEGKEFWVNKTIPAGGSAQVRLKTNFTGQLGQSYQYDFQIIYSDIMEHKIVTKLVGIYEKAPLVEYFFAPTSANLDEEYVYENVVPTGSVTLAKTPNWYGNYSYRYELNITDLNQNYATNLLYVFYFNSSELIAQEKLREDCSDIAVVWMNGTSLQEIPFRVFDCGTSNSRIEMIIPEFNESEVVYVYYGLGE